MKKISYSGYSFPPEIIQQAIWLYLRFSFSFRDVEDLLTERGSVVSYETIRRWVNHCGPLIAADLRKCRSTPHTTWHLDEVVLEIDGRQMYLWRAVNAEGEVLDVLVKSKRNKHAALKLRKLLKKYGFVPETFVDLRSYVAQYRHGAATSHRTMAKQSGGEFASIDSPMRKQDAGLQERWIGATNSLNSRRHLQHLQCPAPSDHSQDAPRVSCRSDEHAA